MRKKITTRCLARAPTRPAKRWTICWTRTTRKKWRRNVEKRSASPLTCTRLSRMTPNISSTFWRTCIFRGCPAWIRCTCSPWRTRWPIVVENWRWSRTRRRCRTRGPRRRMSIPVAYGNCRGLIQPRFIKAAGWSTNRLIDWLTGPLTDWLVHWLIDRLIDWLTDWLFEWLIDWLIDRLNYFFLWQVSFGGTTARLPHAVRAETSTAKTAETGHWNELRRVGFSFGEPARTLDGGDEYCAWRSQMVWLQGARRGMVVEEQCFVENSRWENCQECFSGW